MSDVDAATNEARTRFPFVNLSKAIDRAKQMYDAAGDREVLIADAFQSWGYSTKSSGGFQTIAALKMYGLLADSGTLDGRRLKLTPDAALYFRDERPDRRAELVKVFALKPRLLASLWSSWGTRPPADHIARSHLKVDRNLADQAARSLLAIYKENIDFAGLKGSTTPTEIEQEMATPADDSAAEPSGPAKPNPVQPRKREGILMEGERELTTGLLSKEASFRLIVSGNIGTREIERLIQKLEIDKDILADYGEAEDEAMEKTKGWSGNDNKS